MSMKKNSASNYSWIIKNLLLAALMVLAIVGVASLALRIGTQHGKEVQVPDFTNMIYSEAVQAADAAGVQVRVTDSVYIRKMRKDAVSHQSPAPGAMVKRGRTVDLTTNSRLARRIAMPSLVGLSTSQAVSELTSKGLELGELKYVRDIATNNVMRQQYRGAAIKPGTLVRAGSQINLVVGLSALDDKTYVPDLKGTKYRRAVERIHDRYLNVGPVSYDSSVKTYADSVAAVVYHQSPEAEGKPYLMGSRVSIKLTVDQDKINPESK